MPCFDAYIAVDWSAASKPTPRRPAPDALWMGELTAHARNVTASYHRTRSALMTYLCERIETHLTHANRLFVGFDFSFGYPAGLADALGLKSTSPPWKEIWRKLHGRITDNPDNANNRFEVADELNKTIGGISPGPFWNHPQALDFPQLTRHSPAYPFRTRTGCALARLRHSEEMLPGTHSTWKLFTAGSVGSQTLLGIPRLYELRFLSPWKMYTKIWPFDTGFRNDWIRTKKPLLLLAEVWPGTIHSIVAKRLNAEPNALRDQVQVEEMAKCLRGLDRGDRLCDLFTRPAEILSAKTRRTCEREEGWLLSAGMNRLSPPAARPERRSAH